MNREDSCRPWDLEATNLQWETRAERRHRRSERPKFLGVFYRLAPAGSRRIVRLAYIASMIFMGKYAFMAGLVGYFALGIWFRVQQIELPEE